MVLIDREGEMERYKIKFFLLAKAIEKINQSILRKKYRNFSSFFKATKILYTHFGFLNGFLACWKWLKKDYPLSLKDIYENILKDIEERCGFEIKIKE